MQNLQSLKDLSSSPRKSFTNSPVLPVLTGLFLWLKADEITGLNDTNPITTWADSSTEGNDATQATAGNRPIYRTSIINSLPAVRFTNLADGSDPTNRKFFALPTNAFSAFTEGEIFWVGVVDADPPGDQYQNTFLNFGNYAQEFNDNEVYPFTDGNMYNGFGSSARKNAYWATGGVLDSWHIYDIWSAANDWGMNLDNVNKFTTATNTVSFRSDCRIGRDSSSVETFGLQGYIAEMILYNRKVTPTERTDIYDYLAAKYAI